MSAPSSTSTGTSTGTGRRLLPGAWRPAAAVVAVLGVAGAAVLGVVHHEDTGPGAVDAVVDPALAVEAPTVRRLLWGVVLLGNPGVTVVVVVAIALAAAAVGRWPALVLAVGGVGLAAALTEFVLKPGVGRTLEGTLAFPSGHTTTSAAVGSVLVVLLVAARRPRSPRVRLALAGVVAVAVAGVATSLVALGLHYATDTLGAVAVSTAVVGAVALLIDGVTAARERARARVEPAPRLPVAR